MICHIIGCGPSGKYWDGHGFSIGVNDCFKFGHTTNVLVVVNSLNSFPERKEIVMESRPKDKLYGISCWSSHPNYKHHPYLNQWRGKLEKGKVYKSKTSPFIAVTMAYNWGYDKIVLWGVDFIDHPFRKGSVLEKDKRDYFQLQEELRRKGCSMYLGQTEDHENESVFRDFIPNFTWLASQ